ncbi:hypothetical protein AY599_28065 [Leptolyngbya valderiana BDU 20041]|nr:hypothetical protein AY599_28065 [Leptolyngbya valderiana BDU 20041]
MTGLSVALAWLAAVAAGLASVHVHESILRPDEGGRKKGLWADRAAIGFAFLLGGASASAVFDDPLAGAAAAAALAAGTAAVILDFRVGLTPDLSSALIALSGLVAAQRINPALGWLDMGLGAATAAGVLGLASAYVKVRRGAAGLGSGDIGLAAALGVWCGPAAAALAVALAAVFTIAAALVRGAGPSDRLAFAPGLAAGFLSVIVWNASWLA